MKIKNFPRNSTELFSLSSIRIACRYLVNIDFHTDAADVINRDFLWETKCQICHSNLLTLDNFSDDTSITSLIEKARKLDSRRINISMKGIFIIPISALQGDAQFRNLENNLVTFREVIDVLETKEEDKLLVYSQSIDSRLKKYLKNSYPYRSWVGLETNFRIRTGLNSYLALGEKTKIRAVVI